MNVVGMSGGKCVCGGKTARSFRDGFQGWLSGILVDWRGWRACVACSSSELAIRMACSGRMVRELMGCENWIVSESLLVVIVAVRSSIPCLARCGLSMK